MLKILTMLLISCATYISATPEPIVLRPGDAIAQPLVAYTMDDAITIGTQLSDRIRLITTLSNKDIIIHAQKSLLKRYRIKSGMSIAGGVSALAGSALLLSGQPNLEKYGAGIAVFGLISISVGIAW